MALNTKTQPPEIPRTETPLDLSPKSQNVQKMFNSIAPQYDFLNRLLSLGQDVRWRKALVRELLQATSKQNAPTGTTFHGVAWDLTLYDVACGTGDVALAVRKHAPAYQNIEGFDISPGMLELAQKRAAGKNIQYTLASAESLPVADASCHALTISFGFRNVDNRNKALGEFCRVLKPGGTLCVLEFFPVKKNAFITPFLNKFLPALGGMFSNREAYTYLPASIETMPTPAEFEKQLEEVGFKNITRRSWLFGVVQLVVAVK
jgi:demethylmenaquinone methyltransferase/2-methoxy-6-polyprenyl-1,4-benzoquinol methylase